MRKLVGASRGGSSEVIRIRSRLNLLERMSLHSFPFVCMRIELDISPFYVVLSCSLNYRTKCSKMKSSQYNVTESNAVKMK